MKLIVKSLSITAAILTAGAVLYGPSEACLRLKSLLSSVRQSVNSATPSSQLVEVARQQIAAADGRLQEAEATLRLFRSRADKTQSDVDWLNDCTKVTKARLGTLQPVLKGEVTFFTLNGVNHDRAEAETEARRLLTTLEAHQSQAKLKSSELAELRKAIATAENELGSARVEFDSAKGRLAALELQLQMEEAKAEVAAASGSARASIAEINTGFSRSMGELEKRLATLQVKNESLTRGHSPSAGTIAWGADTGSGVSAAVEAALAMPAPASAPTKPAAPATSALAPAVPSAADATPGVRVAEPAPVKPTVSTTEHAPVSIATVTVAMPNPVETRYAVSSSCGRY
jgi:hypothetical protein